ncbi:hypothetical protein TNCV_3953751 [Trichonephila clavipes]|nr:hypothetical protein TNCV_3953751 [Trichonephila clavipes]
MDYACVVLNCNCNYKGTGTLQMFGFPKEDSLRKKWIQAISRKDFAPSKYSKVAAIRDISHSCLNPNDFTVLNCIVKGHASLSPPSLRLRLCSRFTLLAT